MSAPSEREEESEGGRSKGKKATTASGHQSKRVRTKGAQGLLTTAQ